MKKPISIDQEASAEHVMKTSNTIRDMIPREEALIWTVEVNRGTRNEYYYCSSYTQARALAILKGNCTISCIVANVIDGNVRLTVIGKRMFPD